MRWSKVSGSKNADESYRLRIQDDAEAYSFICVCKRVFGTDYDEGEDGSNEDEEEKDDKKGKQEKRETYQRPVRKAADSFEQTLADSYNSLPAMEGRLVSATNQPQNTPGTYGLSAELASRNS